MIKITLETANQFLKKNMFIISNMPDSLFLFPSYRLLYIPHCLSYFWHSGRVETSKRKQIFIKKIFFK